MHQYIKMTKASSGKITNELNKKQDTSSAYVSREFLLLKRLQGVAGFCKFPLLEVVGVSY